MGRIQESDTMASEFATEAITVYVTEMDAALEGMMLAEEMLLHIKAGRSYDSQVYLENMETIHKAASSLSAMAKEVRTAHAARTFAATGMRDTAPNRALHNAVQSAIASGSPVFVNQPAPSSR
jgi:hypothetical protein